MALEGVPSILICGLGRSSNHANVHTAIDKVTAVEAKAESSVCVNSCNRIFSSPR